MIKFLYKKEKKPKRVLVIGSSGIISKNLCKRLDRKSINYKVIGSRQINLKKDKNASLKISKILKKNDTIILLAAEAPVKNIQTLLNNIQIINSIVDGIEKNKISNLIYLSSDAVYSDSKLKLNEKSKTIPNNFHGMMHIIREKILENKYENKLAIIRPTMIYGKFDTHDGYGPNKFMRLALKNSNIFLFGKGEERRDHVYIDLVTEVLVKCINRKAIGKLNLVSGQIISFKKIALEIIKITNSKSKIKYLRRKGSMPHNGYRPFNIDLLRKKFGKIKNYNLKDGVKKYFEKLNK
ncbi:MAG: NAD-dependent dehydratase [Deltaproteobacteria bacterium]|nr:NAD-dependent dehydratase [Deltaproteobacteria bacterium]|tara:strand:+ start:2428 stop:3312 length:885 start_codon:yes stop_codon:yes gene_type:complete